MKQKECAYVPAVIQLKLRSHFLSFCLEIFSLLYSLFIVIVGILEVSWKGRWVQIQQNRHANPTKSFFQLSLNVIIQSCIHKKFKQRPVMSDRFQSLKVLVPTVRRFFHRYFESNMFNILLPLSRLVYKIWCHMHFQFNDTWTKIEKIRFSTL